MLLGLLPDIDVVGAAADGAEAVALAGQLRPDVVLMDLRMPRCDGVEATRLLHERQPEIKVVVLTTYSDDRSVLDALRAGARGGLSNAEIAGRLVISEATVKSHVNRLFAKIEARDRAQAVAYAYRHGLVD
jgi:DNA-binding NarL/FixJ family response regulator